MNRGEHGPGQRCRSQRRNVTRSASNTCASISVKKIHPTSRREDVLVIRKLVRFERLVHREYSTCDFGDRADLAVNVHAFTSCKSCSSTGVLSPNRALEMDLLWRCATYRRTNVSHIARVPM